MAQVAARPDVGASIDRYLEYLHREWNRLPWVSSEWEGWEEYERLNFVLEWPIREDRMNQLKEWDRDGLLSPSQADRYRELLALVSQYQTILDRLLAD